MVFFSFFSYWWYFIGCQKLCKFYLVKSWIFQYFYKYFWIFFWYVVNILGNSLILSVLAYNHCQLEPVPSLGLSFYTAEAILFWVFSSFLWITRFSTLVDGNTKFSHLWVPEIVPSSHVGFLFRVLSNCFICICWWVLG